MDAGGLGPSLVGDGHEVVPLLDPSSEYPLSMALLQADNHLATLETKAIYESLCNYLNLRGRYMPMSLQGLGDNPKDYDGGGIPSDDPSNNSTKFSKWKIYPKPLPPRCQHMKPTPVKLTPEELAAQGTEDL